MAIVGKLKSEILGPGDVSSLPFGVGYKDPGSAPPAEYGFRGLASSADPLTDFLNMGIQETPEALKTRYGDLFDTGSFGFRGPKSLGMDPSASAALSGKMRGKVQNLIGAKRQNLLNQVPFDFAQRQGTYQGLADANVRRVMGIEAQGAAAREAAKQKRAALTSGLLGVGGAVAGGAVGGGPGAMVGGGIGTGLGGLF